jgi:hypothetical protein
MQSPIRGLAPPAIFFRPFGAGYFHRQNQFRDRNQLGAASSFKTVRNPQEKFHDLSVFDVGLRIWGRTRQQAAAEREAP